MAHSLSAKKRIRQNAKRRAQNRARKTQIKASVKSFDTAIEAGDPAQATEALRAAIRKVDQVAAKGTIHKNQAARKKAQLQKRFNAIAAGN